VVVVLAPVMSVYVADMWWRRNRYDGEALSDESRGGPHWYTRGVNVSGAVGSLVGVVAALMCSSTPVYTGPVSAALGGIDLSLAAGLVLPAAIYLATIHRYGTPGGAR
jgi:purine-cytosine permease-like protein